MEGKETTLDLTELPKIEMNSPPLSHSDADGDETEADDSNDSNGEEEQGGAGVGTGGSVVGGPPLKKGPWTPDEDKRLRAYVQVHGEGNWNQVQRNAGLNRCGKSCRLRWANHLRPELKKGPFDKEEEEKVIELHLKFGNKWAKMSTFLPGRTDNEIKNYWNTRSKRLLKSGESLYPDALVSRVANQDMDCHSPDDSRSKKRPNELLQGNGLEFDQIVFEKLDYKKQSGNLFAPNFAIAINHLKHCASSDSIVSGYNDSEQFPVEPEKTCYSNDVNAGITKNHSVPFGSAIASGPPISNGNFSTSGTIQRPVKTELPSFQFPPSLDFSDSWLCVSPSASPIEQADTFIPSPAPVSPKSECHPSENTGLLDAVVQKRHGLGDPTKSQIPFEVSVPSLSYAYPLSSSSPTIGDNLLESSPLDEFQTSKSPARLDPLFVGSGHHPDDIFPDKYHPPWSDVSLKASFFNEDTLDSKYQPNNDSFDGILYGDSCDEARLLAAGHGHQLGLETCTWNSMPGACDMSEFPNQ